MSECAASRRAQTSSSKGSNPGYMDSIGLGYEALVRYLTRSLVFTSVTHFGQTGPYRHWKSDEITDYAMGGYMYFGGHSGS